MPPLEKLAVLGFWSAEGEEEGGRRERGANPGVCPLATGICVTTGLHTSQPHLLTEHGSHLFFLHLSYCPGPLTWCALGMEILFQVSWKPPSFYCLLITLAFLIWIWSTDFPHSLACFLQLTFSWFASKRRTTLVPWLHRKDMGCA